MSQVIGVLARFCVELPALQAEVRGDPEHGAALRRAVEAARSGGSLGSALRELGIDVSDEGDEDAARGMPPFALPWQSGGGRPAAGNYVCPRDVCGRLEQRKPSGPLPVCHIYDEALRFQPSVLG
ncbi:hypothetical protein ACWGIB_00045 [Streptomyces xiamenensis]